MEDMLMPAPQDAPAEGNAMDDSELAALLAAHEQKAVGYYNGDIAEEQARAIRFYYGDVAEEVPALDGCSRVVDHTVAVHVDNALASILKPFVSADEVVSFEPRGPEDQAQAEQATEYVNYVINCDNPGFQIFHDWFKDGLLTKLGVVKVWWEDQSKVTAKPVPVDAMGLMQARQSEDYLSEQDNGDGTFVAMMRHVEPDGRIKVENVPPEEFLITPQARSIETAPYVAHRPSNFTRSDLIEMGVDGDVVDSLPAHGENRSEEARTQARYRDEDTDSNVALNDTSRDVIAVLDEYIRVDYDGDGVSELRRVVRVGEVILLNEVVEEAPFATVCPVPMPHKVYGRSVADQAIEGQKIGTVLIRQTLDNLYKSNNPRPVIPDTAVNERTYNDLIDSSPGAEISVKMPNQLDWMTVPFTAQHSVPMMEVIARNTEERTGFQRKGNGFNAEALKKNSADTATQAAIDENSRNERAEMIARIFAETGVKRLFKLILKLLSAHQPKARVIRLRNKWVEVDPRGWPEMDLAISVGLGVGNKSEQIGQATTVLETMERLATSPFGYLVSAEHVHKAVQRLYTATGIKNVDDFIADPSQTEAPPPQENPDVVKAKMQMELEGQKAQAKMQSDAQAMQVEGMKSQAKLQLEQAIAAGKQQLEQAKAQSEAMLAREKAAFEAELARQKMAFEQSLAAQRASNDHEVQMSKNRSGGDLSK